MCDDVFIRRIQQYIDNEEYVLLGTSCSRFCISEKSNSYSATKSNLIQIQVHTVDGKVFPPNQNPERCDYVVLVENDKRAIFIELKGAYEFDKGGALTKALSQINTTIAQYYEVIKSIGYQRSRYYAYIIHSDAVRITRLENNDEYKKLRTKRLKIASAADESRIQLKLKTYHEVFNA